jgi:hypothetical protein
MTQPSTSRWAALHVYHCGPLDILLREAVAPLVRDLSATGGLEDWFFIRYGDGGPHLRLRLRAAGHRLDADVLPAARTLLQSYLARRPSFRDPAAATPRRTRASLAPNDTVQDAPYAPETERYGGPVGIGLAEAHFSASSRAVLEAMLARGDAWSYERAMGIALQMHLALSHSLAMDLDEAARFFAALSSVFLPHAMADMTGSPFRRLAPDEEARLRGLFEAAFVPHQERLTRHYAAVWEHLGTGRLADQPWLEAWVRSARANAMAFAAADRGGALTFPDWWFEVHPDIPNRPGDRMILILGSLIHMTNNRLGIQNRDEAYLMFALARALGELSSSSAVRERSS